MNGSLHEYVIKELQKHKGQWTQVSIGSGISKRTIEKIARRESKDPAVSLIERLANYFREKRREKRRRPSRSELRV